jgi:hypothetical protein
VEGARRDDRGGSDACSTTLYKSGGVRQRVGDEQWRRGEMAGVGALWLNNDVSGSSGERYVERTRA